MFSNFFVIVLRILQTGYFKDKINFFNFKTPLLQFVRNYFFNFHRIFGKNIETNKFFKFCFYFCVFCKPDILGKRNLKFLAFSRFCQRFSFPIAFSWLNYRWIVIIINVFALLSGQLSPWKIVPQFWVRSRVGRKIS